MRLNECVLICTNRDDTKRVWLYDLESRGAFPARTWQIRVWPQDWVPPDDGGMHFRLVATELDEASARVQYTPTRESQKAGDWDRMIVSSALYAVLARRLNKRLVSGTPTLAWRALQSLGEAEEEPSGIFFVEGRVGRASATRFGPDATRGMTS